MVSSRGLFEMCAGIQRLGEAWRTFLIKPQQIAELVFGIRDDTRFEDKQMSLERDALLVFEQQFGERENDKH